MAANFWEIQANGLVGELTTISPFTNSVVNEQAVEVFTPAKRAINLFGQPSMIFDGPPAIVNALSSSIVNYGQLAAGKIDKIRIDR